jgi:hypothetical protein
MEKPTSVLKSTIPQKRYLNVKEVWRFCQVIMEKKKRGRINGDGSIFCEKIFFFSHQ